MGATLTTRTRTLRATLTTLTLTLTLSLAPPPNQVREHLENLKLKEINTAKDVRHPATLATQASRLAPRSSKSAGWPAATHTCEPRLALDRLSLPACRTRCARRSTGCSACCRYVAGPLSLPWLC